MLAVMASGGGWAWVGGEWWPASGTRLAGPVHLVACFTAARGGFAPA